MRDVLTTEVPTDLNLLWWAAHAQGWCPYDQNRCHGVDGDAVVSLLKTMPGVPEQLAGEYVRRVWTQTVARHASAPPDPGREGKDLDGDARDWAHRLQHVLGPVWDSLLGPRMALEWHVQRFDPSWAHWMRPTTVRTLAVVGTEKAALMRGPWAAVGALSLAPAERLLHRLDGRDLDRE